jgi:hypothetical protein
MIMKCKFMTLLLTAFTALPLLAQTSQDFPSVVQIELGDTEFLPGDSITIEEVRGTSDTIQPGGTYSVTGTYTLTSHDEADLSFFATTTNATPTPVDPAQRLHLTKGTGSFRLIKKMNEVGYLHLTFYSRSTGQGFGGVYFGQGQWVLRDKHFRYNDNRFHSNDTMTRSATAATSEPVSTAGPNQALFEYLGNPVAPPPDMKAAYTKEGLTQAVQAAAQTAGISLAKLEIDDSEYPFLVGVTFARDGDKDKLRKQLFANTAYASSGGVGGEISYAMNIVPYQAFPEDTSQRIHRRMLLREAVLYDRITANR